MAKKDSLTHNHYIAPALRRKNRLLRETTASHTQSISKAMDIAWPTFAAAPHGQFSKNTEIMDVDQALIYRLAHKRFDMNRVYARCRTDDYGRPLNKAALDSAIERVASQSKTEMSSLFKASEEIADGQDGVSPEFRRFLSNLRGKDVDIFFDDAFAAYRAQGQIDLSTLTSEDIERLFPPNSPERARMEQDREKTFDTFGLLLYMRWRHWSHGDTQVGVDAIEKLVQELEDTKKHYSDDFLALGKRFHLAEFKEKSSASGMKDEAILAACIMASDHDEATGTYRVIVDRFRAITDIYNQAQSKNGRKRRRR